MARTPAPSSSRNPLAADPAREHRVRERAYHLWEADGKPHGSDVHYWERARELISKEEGAGGSQLQKPPASPNSPRETKSPQEPGVKQAGIRANPDRLAEQGAVKPTAEPKRRARAKPKK
jgi:hypothetical protein